MDDFSVKILSELTSQQRGELGALLTEAEFIAESDSAGDWLDKAVAGSVIAMGVFNSDGRMVGFGRALGDGVSDCYIQDVVIASTFRGRNLGKKLVQSLISELKKRNIDWIGLVAVPGKAGFYEKLGFRPAEGFVPMILADE